MVSGLTPLPDAWVMLPALLRETFLALDFSAIFYAELATVVLAFLFVDLFDTAGTLLGVGRLGGFLDEQGELPRANQDFASDAVGTMAVALLGTSTATAYVESAAGGRSSRRW